MEFASKAELKALLAELNNAVDEYDDSSSVNGMLSRVEVKGKARQIFNATMDANQRTFDYFLHMNELIAIRTFISLGVFAAIPLDGSISLGDLAHKTRSSKDLIARLAYPLVGTGFLARTAVDTGEYKHTRFSAPFMDTKNPGQGVAFNTIWDVYFRPTLTLDEMLEKNLPLHGRYQAPASNNNNPFVHYYGKVGQPVWETMATMPAILKDFQATMKLIDTVVPNGVGVFNFSKFKHTETDAPDRKELVDVGGGYGRIISEILEATPALDPKRCVLQDLEDVLAIANEPKALGVELVTIDFHKQSPVPGAKAYYMRCISHDYSDLEATNIFRNIAKVMKADSTLVVVDQILPDAIVEGSLPAGTMDSFMFCIGGIERTEGNFRKCFDEAGLVLVHVTRIPGVYGCVIEARLKST